MKKKRKKTMTMTKLNKWTSACGRDQGYGGWGGVGRKRSSMAHTTLIVPPTKMNSHQNPPAFPRRPHQPRRRPASYCRRRHNVTLRVGGGLKVYTSTKGEQRVRVA